MSRRVDQHGNKACLSICKIVADDQSPQAKTILRTFPERMLVLIDRRVRVDMRIQWVVATESEGRWNLAFKRGDAQDNTD